MLQQFFKKLFFFFQGSEAFLLSPKDKGSGRGMLLHAKKTVTLQANLFLHHPHAASIISVFKLLNFAFTYFYKWIVAI